ncbi:MAPEG family protein [Sphingomonas sp.]|uniref:MAPEG family protein n=1 Tax=Sphingomonas sp. TaxID=28214 RepID=UPI00286B864C|nr:MAPEG family protein [Sphingomonas sp.]
MEYSPILAPVVALVAWSLVVMLWMVVTRMPAMKKAGISLNGLVGGRGANLEGVVPDEVQWKSHNYMHLMEQPTLFYAIALTIALMGMGHGINYWLAWGYVGLRVIHSIVQATVNIVMYRFALFFLASLCLIGLTIHAAARIAHDCGLI